jgi:hypothetical protein
VRTPNAKLLADLGPQFAQAADETAVLGLVYGVENKAAATHQYVLQNLETARILQVTASVLPVETEHAVVIGTLLGKSPKDTIPVSFQSQDGFVDPSTFPVGSGTG